MGSVSASDPDGRTVTYAITAGNDDGKFGIDTATGEVSVTGTLGDEAGSPYSLTSRPAKPRGPRLRSRRSLRLRRRPRLLRSACRDVASEKSRRCHLQQPPGPPPRVPQFFVSIRNRGSLSGEPMPRTNREPVRVENTFPAIVSRDQFTRIAAMMRSRAPSKVNPRRISSSYLLSGLVKCAECPRFPT